MMPNAMSHCQKITTLQQKFFSLVQGYCYLLAVLSLVIKMGRNVKKCTIYLYNIPDNVEVPEFYSIAWSYDSHGPLKGSIKTVMMQQDSITNHLLCYQAPKTIYDLASTHIKHVLNPRTLLMPSWKALMERKKS